MTMKNKTDGVVERFALAPHGNGTGIYLLIVGDDNVYYFDCVRKAYYQEDVLFKNDNDHLVTLTRPGDHVWFDSEATIGVPFSFRNWTLEHRLFGKTKDIFDAEGLLEIKPVVLNQIHDL